jgi:hypothetical protein
MVDQTTAMADLDHIRAGQAM